MITETPVDIDEDTVIQIKKETNEIKDEIK